MKKKKILKFQSSKPKGCGRNLTANIVAIDGEEHLIVDYFRKKKPVYRMVMNETDFNHYDFETEVWDKKSGWRNDHRYDIRDAKISESDIKKIVEFCKIKETNVWDCISDTEYRIEREKEKKREERQRQRIDALFEGIPEEPEELDETIRKKIAEKNIIYYKRNRKSSDYMCCQCGKKYSRDNVKKIGFQEEKIWVDVPVKGNYETCAKCGETGTLCQRGRAKNTRDYFNIILYQNHGEYLLIRAYYVTCERSPWSKMSTRIREYERMILKSGTCVIAGAYGDEWRRINKFHLTSSEVAYEVGYERAKNASGMKYMPRKLPELLYQGYLSRESTTVRHIQALETYARAPQIEAIYKVGLIDICREILWARGQTSMIDKRQTEVHKILKMTKEEYRYLLDNSRESFRGKWARNIIEISRRTKRPIRELQCVEEFATDAMKDKLYTTLKYVSPIKLINYLKKQQEISTRTITSLLIEYRDYLLEQQAAEEDMEDDIVLRPRDLVHTHVRLLEEREQAKNQKYINDMMEKYENISKNSEKIPKKYTWQQDGLMIRPAKNAAEIVMEGRILHHCVGSDYQRYMSNFNKNIAWILLLRREKEQSIPYITVEIQNKKIVQWHGEHNTKPDREQVEDFLKKYIEHIGG